MLSHCLLSVLTSVPVVRSIHALLIFRNQHDSLQSSMGVHKDAGATVSDKKLAKFRTESCAHLQGNAYGGSCLGLDVFAKTPLSPYIAWLLPGFGAGARSLCDRRVHAAGPL